MPRKTNKLSLQAQEKEIYKMAEERGVQNNFFFVTTFKRYKVQMGILEKLEKSIKTHGDLVTKEYVKGRENICVNPAITEYNKTSTAANGTVSTLINIIRSVPQEQGEGLADIMRGLMDDE